jgi:uncharacterized membrane protein YphA (DoxX/SURF4 family)
VPILGGAVLLVSWPRGFFTKEQSLEFTLLILYLLVLLVLFGSGRLSADRLLSRRRREHGQSRQDDPTNDRKEGGDA